RPPSGRRGYSRNPARARSSGAPLWYTCCEEVAQLTAAGSRRPDSVSLFDEMEEGWADVFNVLLQILDDGRLTDSKGRTVDFKNTLIIMTSNLGAMYLTSDALATPEAFERASTQVMNIVQEHFRPEFLNRVDDIIIFKPLQEAQLIRIVDLRLADLRKMLADRRISIELTPAAKEMIFREGYDRAYGARPLKRA